MNKIKGKLLETEMFYAVNEWRKIKNGKSAFSIQINLENQISKKKEKFTTLGAFLTWILAVFHSHQNYLKSKLTNP